MPAYSDNWPTASSLTELARLQDDVVSRAQLFHLGVTRHAIRGHVRAGRWRLVARTVVVLHRGTLTFNQRCWVALLAAGPRAALGGLTAAELDGLSGCHDDTIHVIVPRNARKLRTVGVRVHESRRFGAGDVHPARVPRRTRLARSVIDAAAWSPSSSRACAVVVASVQQRLVTPEHLRAELAAAANLRYRRVLLDLLDDVEGGSHSLPEVEMARLCRQAGLPTPQRQAQRRDHDGRRRYLDMFWPEHRLAVEVDGAFHRDAKTWNDDLDRQNDVAATGVTVLRFSSATVRTNPERVVAQIRNAVATSDLRELSLILPTPPLLRGLARGA